MFEHEDFVIVRRAGHPIGKRLTLARYCAAPHLVVSVSGDPHGMVDTHLAKRGLSRRVMLTVSNFMQALAIVAESDLVAAMPRRLRGEVRRTLSRGHVGAADSADERAGSRHRAAGGHDGWRPQLAVRPARALGEGLV